MDQIYPYTTESTCKLISTRPETVRRILDYSRALHIVEHGDHCFENNLN